jgi:serine/threonine-protein kinase
MQLGPYTLVRAIGDGGMGYVYQASRAGSGESYAVKVLLPELIADDEFRTRFQREAALLQKLDHPSIIPVYDAGQDGDYLYFVMRFVRGVSLYDLLLKRHFSPVATWQILNPMAAALDYAHDLGIIHRDVKPGNILIEVVQGDSGPRNLVFLADFGLSLVRGWKSVTGAGISVGTPHYMSPEQVMDYPLTPASDVYGLALVVYEMLLGRRPFYAPTDPEVAHKHLGEKLPAPSRLSFGFPEALERVLLRGLNKDPMRRYAAAGELALEYAEAVRSLSPAQRQADYWVGPPRP